MYGHCLNALLSECCDVQVSILERTWRWAWRRKGDVYHLLFDMCRYVDGRVWPTQDKTDVLLFLSLMHHVTGQWPPSLLDSTVC